MLPPFRESLNVGQSALESHPQQQFAKAQLFVLDGLDVEGHDEAQLFARILQNVAHATFRVCNDTRDVVVQNVQPEHYVLLHDAFEKSLHFEYRINGEKVVNELRIFRYWRRRAFPAEQFPSDVEKGFTHVAVLLQKLGRLLARKT